MKKYYLAWKDSKNGVERYLHYLSHLGPYWTEDADRAMPLSKKRAKELCALLQWSEAGRGELFTDISEEWMRMHNKVWKERKRENENDAS